MNIIEAYYLYSSSPDRLCQLIAGNPPHWWHIFDKIRIRWMKEWRLPVRLYDIAGQLQKFE
jgi:hypothetical protein